MKSFLKIVIIGAVLFNVVCIIQDWRNFFHVGRDAAASDDAALEAELTGTIREFIALSQHAYQSGGDSRFAERLPASEAVVTEMLDEIEYLKKNGRVQLSQLARFEVLDVEQSAANRATVRTAEDWIVYTADPATGARFEPDARHSVYAEYRLARRGAGWQIAQWDLVAPPEPDSEVP